MNMFFFPGKNVYPAHQFPRSKYFGYHALLTLHSTLSVGYQKLSTVSFHILILTHDLPCTCRLSAPAFAMKMKELNSGINISEMMNAVDKKQ